MTHDAPVTSEGVARGALAGAPQSDRMPWPSLPAAVRSGIGSALGSQVVSHAGRQGGFSPGVAAGLVLADGRKAFVKAVGGPVNPDTVALYRQEVEVQSWLPRGPWTPELLATYDDGEWVALAYAYVDAPTVAVPWSAGDVDAVLRVVRSMHAALDPAPVEAPGVADAFGDDFAGWRTWASSGVPGGASPWVVRHLDRLAALEAGWAAAAEGTTLLHMDLRHDNLLVRGADVWVVDWPWCARGAAWVDVVLLAVAIEAYGGPSAATVFEAYGTPVEEPALGAVLAGLSGYFVPHGMRPAPPGLPYLRAVQARQGDVAAAWLDALGLW